MEKSLNLKEKFERDGLVQVRDIFNVDFAQSISDNLYNFNDSEWNFVYMKDGDVRTLIAGEDNKMEIFNARYTIPDEVDTFGYHYYRRDKDELSEKFVSNVVFNEGFKKLVYNITNIDYSHYGYFMSKYVDGDYNGWHHDEGNGELAMIFHFSPRWSPHWGGLTHYWKRTEDNADWGNLNTTYECIGVSCPIFNSMVLMDVRKESKSSHMVSHINPGLPYGRITINGWIG